MGKGVPFSFKIPIGITGSRKLIAIVNPKGTVIERTTLNNAVGMKSISVVEPFTNLTAISLKITGAPKAGKTLPVIATVKNNSNQAFDGSVPVAIRFMDTINGLTQTIGNFTQKLKLSIGQTGSFTLKVPIPIGLAGHTGKLILVLDPQGTLGETNAKDNTMSGAAVKVS